MILKESFMRLNRLALESVDENSFPLVSYNEKQSPSDTINLQGWLNDYADMGVFETTGIDFLTWLSMPDSLRDDIEVISVRRNKIKDGMLNQLKAQDKMPI